MMVIGYSCPTLIVLCTLITEFSAPECALLRPRFEEKCFFAGNWYICMTSSFNDFNFYSFKWKIEISSSKYFCDFFLEPLSRFVWFHLPILILLMINAFVFCVLCRTICKLEGEKAKLGIKNKENKSENIER